jgi:hypothetical protein
MFARRKKGGDYGRSSFTRNPRLTLSNISQAIYSEWSLPRPSQVAKRIIGSAVNTSDGHFDPE